MPTTPAVSSPPDIINNHAEGMRGQPHLPGDTGLAGGHLQTSDPGADRDDQVNPDELQAVPETRLSDIRALIDRIAALEGQLNQKIAMNSGAAPDQTPNSTHRTATAVDVDASTSPASRRTDRPRPPPLIIPPAAPSILAKPGPKPYVPGTTKHYWWHSNMVRLIQSRGLADKDAVAYILENLPAGYFEGLVQGARPQGDYPYLPVYAWPPQKPNELLAAIQAREVTPEVIEGVRINALFPPWPKAKSTNTPLSWPSAYDWLNDRFRMYALYTNRGGGMSDSEWNKVKVDAAKHLMGPTNARALRSSEHLMGTTITFEHLRLIPQVHLADSPDQPGQFAAAVLADPMDSQPTQTRAPAQLNAAVGWLEGRT